MSTRGKRFGGRWRGRGQVRHADTHSTQTELPHREIEIDNSTTDIETTMRSRGRGQGRGANTIHAHTTSPSEIDTEHNATQVETSAGSRGARQGNGTTTHRTSNSSTGVSPPEIDMDPFEEDMDPRIEGQSSDLEMAHDSRVRGPSHGIQAPNTTETKPFIQPDGDGFVPFNVTRGIMKLSRQFLGPWPTWGKVPRGTKDQLFEKFRENYNWLPIHEAGIRSSWEQANKNMKNHMYHYRRTAQQIMGNDVQKWKSVVPSCMSEDHWAELCDGPFSDPAYQAKCEKARQNRLKVREGSISKHTGGSISFREHARRLAAKEKRPVSQLEVYDHCHKSRKGEGDYVDKKYKQVRDTYVSEFANKHGKEPSIDTELDCEAWVEASGGPSKGRIYGFGSTYSAREIGQTSHASSSSTLTYPPISQDALKKALDEAMAKQREELFEEVNRREEAAKKREDETNTLVEELSKQKQEIQDLLEQLKKQMEKNNSRK